MKNAAKNAKPELKVAVSQTGSTVNVSASGPGLAAEAGAELWFVVTEDHLVVDVKRGENANRTLKHSGVVRVLQSAGDAGKAVPVQIKVDSSWKKENVRVVGFVQSKKDRRILSVGYSVLP